MDTPTPASARFEHSPLLPLALLLSASCQTPRAVAPDPYELSSGAPVEAAQRPGDEIVIAGRRFSTGRPVVLWSDAGGYNAYDTEVLPGTSPDYIDEGTGRRYEPGRKTRTTPTRVLVRPGSTDLNELARSIDQFVLHFDVAGTSKTCFRVLQHLRGLSVHFMLDIDGTIYQTLDVRDTAWHATKSNPRSIGVEIAQIGAWPAGDLAAIERWYSTDSQGVFIDVPDDVGDGGVRTPGFIGRPARPDRIEGRINGTRLVQYDFTEQQYESLTALIATLSAELPQIRRVAPLDDRGAVREDVLSQEDWEFFSGVLGHNHVQVNKVDPGPAFDWERLLAGLRAQP